MPRSNLEALAAPLPAPTVAVISATEPLGISGECPPAPRDVPTPSFDDPLNAGDAIVEYLNSGGSVEALRDLASESLIFNRIGTTGGFARPDLNGDGIPETVISLIDSTDDYQQGRVYVAMCEGGRYRLGFATDFLYTDVHIGTTFDLTGDGLDDLFIVREECGAHTCFSWVEVVGWYQNELRNLIEDVIFDLPSTGIQIFGPVTDGSYLIYMTGNGVGSLGAGPYHPRTVTWGWDPDTHLFRPIDFHLQSSTYRIHFIHDGDRSFALGNYPLALDNYNRVIHDSQLQDWPSAEFAPEYAADERQELAAYARFRRVLTRLKMDEFASAEVHYEDLIENHPQGEPGDGFARMGRIFWEEFTDSRDFDEACAAAQDFASANPSEILDHFEYGYSNPTYTPTGLCPASP